jgi:hypothetical protein
MSRASTPTHHLYHILRFAYPTRGVGSPPALQVCCNSPRTAYYHVRAQ